MASSAQKGCGAPSFNGTPTELGPIAAPAGLEEEKQTQRSPQQCLRAVPTPCTSPRKVCADVVVRFEVSTLATDQGKETEVSQLTTPSTFARESPPLTFAEAVCGGFGGNPRGVMPSAALSEMRSQGTQLLLQEAPAPCPGEPGTCCGRSSLQFRMLQMQDLASPSADGPTTPRKAKKGLGAEGHGSEEMEPTTPEKTADGLKPVARQGTELLGKSNDAEVLLRGAQLQLQEAPSPHFGGPGSRCGRSSLQFRMIQVQEPTLLREEADPQSREIGSMSALPSADQSTTPIRAWVHNPMAWVQNPMASGLD